MKKQIVIWQLSGFFITSLLGTLLHFLYDWLGETIWIAPFSGVNESTWEHMKLLFWPMFLFATVQSIFFYEKEIFWRIKLKGILLGIILIPIIFYTYNGVIGKSPDWANISIFFVSGAISYLYETRLFNFDKMPYRPSKSPQITLCIVALLFILFTFFTPQIGIFRDPITGTYGI